LKKLSILITIAAAIALAGPKQTGSLAKVCHASIGTWGKVLEVSDKQLGTHLAHGDYQLDPNFNSPDGLCPGRGEP
jgi:hypothetical protein